MITHRLKTSQTWFARVIDGNKTAEIRKHDRDFQAGDTLHLVETYEDNGHHLNDDGDTVWHKEGDETGREWFVNLTHVLPYDQFPDGLKPGYCLLSFKGGRK